jgi:hypothetical protein
MGVRVFWFALRMVLLAGFVSSAARAEDANWIRPGHAGDPLVWGRRDGIVFGIPSAGGMKGPRGLIRVGVLSPGETAPKVLNYIAIEPVVAGGGARFSRMAFSELEMSTLDPGEHGKRLWTEPVSGTSGDGWAGELQTLHTGSRAVERLSVRIDVERYTANGANVYLIASMDSDHPAELRLSVFRKDDSPPIEELTVTATMGNYERLRLLWLRNRVVDSRQLFDFYRGEGFAELGNYSLDEMTRNQDGDAIVYASSNEANPGTTQGNGTAHWPYLLPKFTQYWRVAARDIQPDLRVRVNGRRVYWGSVVPVLGGIAFENFEVRERFVVGQSFVYGISRREPWELDGDLFRLR